ncbi:hypothetical protein GCM10007971_35890 [Oceanobacillus indicireducens]|uniref:Uncharacterized protein n=1 Tax=Oceanobacillus indicireducens TaxID=1004261 RepID=A0A918D4U5_9BACI|nr:hypothetical protein GCM10007971_35890 [Oceanobacillus indicireducens]
MLRNESRFNLQERLRLCTIIVSAYIEDKRKNGLQNRDKFITNYDKNRKVALWSFYA